MLCIGFNAAIRFVCVAFFNFLIFKLLNALNWTLNYLSIMYFGPKLVRA